jgi:integrase
MRAMHRLTAAQVRAAEKPGMFCDGAGLYLLVGPTGARSWIFRFGRHGKVHEMGLGPLSAFNLAEARERATKARQALADGADPLELKRRQAQERVVETMRRRTFQEAAEELIEAKRPGWKTVKSDWGPSLAAHVYPKIGALPVAAVDTDAVLKCVRPIWQDKAETARRVLNRIEGILDYATVKGYRPEGPNPAKWDGNVQHLLPSRGEMARAGKVARVKHHEALPYTEVPDFLAMLRARRGRTAQSQLTAATLEWAILTATRIGEVRHSTFENFDWGRRLWTIPAERMKASKEHVVPLADAVRPLWDDTVWRAGGAIGNGRMFPASEEAVLKLAKKIAGKPITLHGFRSSFRDWCAENGVSRDLAEASLAHDIGSKVEKAYNRTALIEQRRAVMERWAAFAYGS